MLQDFSHALAHTKLHTTHIYKSFHKKKKYMENLKKYLQFKEDQIKQLVETSGIPTEAQLTGFIGAFAKQFLNDIVTVHAPTKVKKIATDGLGVMGWDHRRNSGTDLSTDRFVEGIDHMQAEILLLNDTPEPTASELQNISEAADKLWDLDVNRVHPNSDYAINVQGGKKVYDKRDTAREPFFSFVDAKVMEKPTFRSFVSLLDNYVATTGTAEVVTSSERKENYDFLYQIMETGVMKYCHSLLAKKGLAPADKQEFVNFLHELWFGLYRRTTNNDSSGFEHVFLGEIKNGAVTGMHNWIQLYQEEQKGTLDYQGFIKPRRKPSIQGCHVEKNEQQLVTIQFEWNGALKNVSSSMIGTSPEFEMALYTLCFVAGDEKNVVRCGPYRMELTCYKYTSRGKKYIGTSFPSDLPLDENEAASKIQSTYRGNSTRNNSRH
jgi:poly(U)-specific endoribonuclease